MARLSPTELAEEISRFVNGAGDDNIKELAELMAKDHPTLQQLKTGLVFQFIKHMANKPYTDARNQAASEMSKAALEGIRQMWVKKFVDSGMTQEKAELQSQACMKEITLPFI
jgi:hypothetical protein